MTRLVTSRTDRVGLGPGLVLILDSGVRNPFSDVKNLRTKGVTKSQRSARKILKWTLD